MYRTTCLTHTKWTCLPSAWKLCCILHTIPLQHSSDHSSMRCQNLKTHKVTRTMKWSRPPAYTHTHTHAHNHQHTCGSLYLAGCSPSLSPQCVITVLLSPCGNVITDYSAGTEREVSHTLHNWFDTSKLHFTHRQHWLWNQCIKCFC